MEILIMRLIYFVLTLFSTPLLWGQSNLLSQTDSVKAKEWIDDVSFYASLFTGKEQVKYPFSYENHPFYIQREPLIGSLLYDGVNYPAVGLRWDIYRDELMAVSSDQRFNIVLIPQRLEEARFSGKKIFYLDSNEMSGVSKPGYYIKLYDDKCKVWTKVFAELKNKHVDQRLVTYFAFRQYYYIQKGNTLFQVNYMSAIIRAFADKKKELKAFQRKHRLNFDSDPENVIVLMVREYERLTQTEQ